MSVDVVAEVKIERPRAAVAAFMFDPKNDPIWTGGLVDCHPEQEGLLETGHKIERVSKMMGRKFGYLIEVVAHEPERSVDMVTDKPFRMEVRYQLDDDGEHTRARIYAKGGGSGFFKVAGGLLGKMVQRSIQNDLESLKTWLESS
jgi:hypothetical protein